MAADRNPVTGAPLITRPASEEYRDGWDRIFGRKDVERDNYGRPVGSFAAAATPSRCGCRACDPTWWGMFVCPRCGFKRCPGADDHTNPCTPQD